MPHCRVPVFWRAFDRFETEDTGGWCSQVAWELHRCVHWSWYTGDRPFAGDVCSAGMGDSPCLHFDAVKRSEFDARVICCWSVELHAGRYRELHFTCLHLLPLSASPLILHVCSWNFAVFIDTASCFVESRRYGKLNVLINTSKYISIIVTRF